MQERIYTDAPQVEALKKLEELYHMIVSAGNLTREDIEELDEAYYDLEGMIKVYL